MHDINTDVMNRLMEENEEANEVITHLIENHHAYISTITHELRNPLTLISSSLQMIESAYPEVKDYSVWPLLMEDVGFMKNLLEDLSLYNNGSYLHTSVFSIEKLLKNIALSFAVALDEEDSGIEFTSSVPDGLGDFSGDCVKLKEVFLNLLRNAKESIEGEGQIRLTACRSKGGLCIRIADTGCGIPEKHLASIFEPFKTYKAGGTGLGLALSRQIIEAHGGTIEVTSEVGKGTVFTVILP